MCSKDDDWFRVSIVWTDQFTWCLANGKIDPRSASQNAQANYSQSVIALLLWRQAPGGERVTVVSLCSQENLTHCFLNNTFHDTVQSVFTFLTELAEKCKVKIHTFIVIKQSQEKPVSLLGGEKREMFKWLHLVAIWYKQNTILSSQGIKYMWETSFNTFDTFFPKILWWI